MTTELIGYLSGFLISISLLPQVIKTVQTRSTDDLSIAWTAIHLSGVLLQVYYGYLIGSKPLVFMLGFEACLIGVLFVLVINNTRTIVAN